MTATAISFPAPKSGSVERERELQPCDPSTVAPLTRDGKPDMYNFMPTRLVPFDEAEARGWPCFYDASICRYGHQAPRYVSNRRLCVDCHRVKAGKTPIGGSAKHAAEYKNPRPYTQRQPAADMAAGSGAHPAVPAELPVDRQEKRFLESYALTRDFDAAAATVNVPAAHMDARMAYSPAFKQAVHELEDRLGLKRTPAPNGPFEWDEDKRARFLEVWIDTGDEATARDAIRVTPSEMFRELERNDSFSARYEEARPLAMKAFKEKAQQLALAGNDKLLTLVVKAEHPDYRDNIKVDMRVTETLTDQQLDNQLARLIKRFGARLDEAVAIDAEVIDVPALPAPNNEDLL